MGAVDLVAPEQEAKAAMSLRDWIAASDPSAIGFMAGILFTCVLFLVIRN